VSLCSRTFLRRALVAVLRRPVTVRQARWLMRAAVAVHSLAGWAEVRAETLIIEMEALS
jgi:hypothetical protein